MSAFTICDTDIAYALSVSDSYEADITYVVSASLTYGLNNTDVVLDP